MFCAFKTVSFPPSKDLARKVCPQIEDFAMSPSGKFMAFTDQKSRTELAVSSVDDNFTVQILHYHPGPVCNRGQSSIFNMLFEPSERYLIAIYREEEVNEEDDYRELFDYNWILVFSIPSFKLVNKIKFNREPEEIISPRVWFLGKETVLYCGGSKETKSAFLISIPTGERRQLDFHIPILALNTLLLDNRKTGLKELVVLEGGSFMKQAIISNGGRMDAAHSCSYCGEDGGCVTADYTSPNMDCYSVDTHVTRREGLKPWYGIGDDIPYYIMLQRLRIGVTTRYGKWGKVLFTVALPTGEDRLYVYYCNEAQWTPPEIMEYSESFVSLRKITTPDLLNSHDYLTNTVDCGSGLVILHAVSANGDSRVVLWSPGSDLSVARTFKGVNSRFLVGLSSEGDLFMVNTVAVCLMFNYKEEEMFTLEELGLFLKSVRVKSVILKSLILMSLKNIL
eukprot:sb/3464630/